MASIRTMAGTLEVVIINGSYYCCDYYYIVVDIINSYYQSQVFHENKKSIKIVIFKTDYCI